MIHLVEAIRKPHVLRLEKYGSLDCVHVHEVKKLKRNRITIKPYNKMTNQPEHTFEIFSASKMVDGKQCRV